jgi:hypothetical protein
MLSATPYDVGVAGFAPLSSHDLTSLPLRPSRSHAAGGPPGSVAGLPPWLVGRCRGRAIGGATALAGSVVEDEVVLADQGDRQRRAHRAAPPIAAVGFEHANGCCAAGARTNELVVAGGPVAANRPQKRRRHESTLRDYTLRVTEISGICRFRVRGVGESHVVIVHMFESRAVDGGGRTGRPEADPRMLSRRAPAVPAENRQRAGTRPTVPRCGQRAVTEGRRSLAATARVCSTVALRGARDRMPSRLD